MYAVIFKAKVKKFDSEYRKTAEKLRDRAINEFGCTEFISTCEDNTEIAISYWPDLESIKNWKQDSDHQQAKKKGMGNWYESCEIEVVEVLRKYHSTL